MLNNLDIIEQYRRLSPQTQREVAEQFGLTDETDVDAPSDGSRANRWLGRANNKGLLAEFGKVVSERSTLPMDEIRDALQAIVDCYGVGYKDRETALAHLGALIMDAKEVLDRQRAAEHPAAI